MVIANIYSLQIVLFFRECNEGCEDIDTHSDDECSCSLTYGSQYSFCSCSYCEDCEISQNCDYDR